MQYSTLGGSGLVVSRMAFGAMTFTAGNKDTASLSKVQAGLADQLVGRSLDAGITLFDTADAYAGGESEALLGKALKSRRSNVIIATKVGFRSGPPLTQSGLSRRHILWSVDQSLKRLDTDWIDLYIAHRQDEFTPLEETLSALDATVKSGKVRYLGFSNWSAWKVAAAMEMQRANGWAPFTHGQMHYSLLGRDIERDLIPMMCRYGRACCTGPLASGFLSGKYTQENLSDPENRYSGFDILPFDKKKGFALVDDMRRMAAKHRASVAQIALAWLLGRGQVSSVILGASKLTQLEDNLGSATVKLDSADTAQLEAATALAPVYPNWFNDKIAGDQPLRAALNLPGPRI